MDIDLPIWHRSVPYLLIYFAPVLIGAYRRWRDRDASWPVWGLFLIVFFTGWSGIGWLWALRMAFRDKSLGWLSQPVSGGGGGGGDGIGSGSPTDGPTFWSTEQRETTCGICGGSGSHYCNGCAGRGQWYEGSTLKLCPSCGSRGRITCHTCIGSGKVR